MKTKILIIITLFGLFLSCEKPVSKADLEGTWYCHHCKEVYEFSFQKDTILWKNEYGFIQKGFYEIVDNHLQIITVKNDTIKFLITHYQTAIDTFFANSLVLDTMIFRGRLGELLQEEFELIDLETNNKLKVKYPFQALPIRFFYTNNQRSLRIKDSFKNTNLGNLSMYWGYHYPKEREVLLFIDNNILVSDFAELQYWLANDNINKVSIITNNNGFNRFSSIDVNIKYADDVYVNPYWFEENSPPPPPPPSYDYEAQKAHFKNIPKIVINTKADLSKLNPIQKGQKIHILFDVNLEMETFLKVQIKLKELEKTNEIRWDIQGIPNEYF
jgi:hypothetical protein